VDLNAYLDRSPLRDIARKVAKGMRLGEEDALTLYGTRDLHALALLADHAKRQRHGDKVYYNRNRHVDYSNLCRTGCSFCVYARREGQEGAFDLTHDEIVEKAREAKSQGATEVHIVGGLHPIHPLEWYEGMLKALKAALPDLHLKCFTAVEIHHFSRLSGSTHAEVLKRLKDAGLGSLPGGGAEIFAPRVRERLCAGKATAEEWGDVHRCAHRLGIPTNATMLYGHIETYAERVDHLRRLRDWQDETGGFQAFVPLAYHQDRPDMPPRSIRGGSEHLKNYAVSRLFLDNFPHLKAYWVMSGVSMAQVALSYGVDDIDGTVMEEHIYRLTGVGSPQALSAAELEGLVIEAGRDPVERDPFYREIGRVRR
jgi:aminodeoxyfutalosine synthase